MPGPVVEETARRHPEAVEDRFAVVAQRRQRAARSSLVAPVVGEDDVDVVVAPGAGP